MESRKKPGRDGRGGKPGGSDKRSPRGASQKSGSGTYSDFKRAGSSRTKNAGEGGEREKRSFSSDKQYRKPFRTRESDNTAEGGEKRERRGYSSSRSEGTDRPFVKKAGSFESIGGEKRERRSFDKKKSSTDSTPYRKSSSFHKGDDNEKRERRSFGADRARSADRPFRKRDENGSDNKFEHREKRDYKSETFTGGERPFRRNRSESETESFSDKKQNSGESRRPRITRKPSSSGLTYSKPSIKKQDDGRIRLNKVISGSGICSRREADDMIVAGLVSVNGEIVTTLGTKVLPTDEIKYNGERLRKERPVYILLNKPKDYVTTVKDPYAKRTVLELIEGACKERVFPVGRLDRNTTGVLLLTNDGELAKKLTHPSHNRKKIYHVHLDSNFRQADIEKLLSGFELEDGFSKADDVHFVDAIEKNQIGIEIHSGRNRIVRRMLEHLEYKVVKLDRVYFCGLTKKGLQRGHWRFLTAQEVGMLNMGSYD